MMSKDFKNKHCVETTSSLINSMTGFPRVMPSNFVKRWRIYEDSRTGLSGLCLCRCPLEGVKASPA